MLTHPMVSSANSFFGSVSSERCPRTKAIIPILMEFATLELKNYQLKLEQIILIPYSIRIYCLNLQIISKNSNLQWQKG